MLKSLSFLLWLLMMPAFVFCQQDSLPKSGIQLKPGFYKTYEEFLNNDPSITGSFTTTLLRVSKKDSTVYAAKFKIDELDGPKGKVWGGCDGTYAYINFGVMQNQRFYRLQCYGPNPYFIYKEKTLMSPGGGLIAAMMLATSAAIPPSFELFFVNAEGKGRVGKKKLLSALFKDDPALEKEYESKKYWSDKEEVDFIIRYNNNKLLKK